MTEMRKAFEKAAYKKKALIVFIIGVATIILAIMSIFYDARPLYANQGYNFVVFETQFWAGIFLVTGLIVVFSFWHRTMMPAAMSILSASYGIWGLVLISIDNPATRFLSILSFTVCAISSIMESIWADIALKEELKIDYLSNKIKEEFIKE